MSDLASKLANSTKNGYVIAPAGYGKTHLIASSVKLAHERQLILTHTYAGVNSLRKKMALLEVPNTLYVIDTIASWSLKFCCSYPKNSNWNIDIPTTKEQWKKLYISTKELLQRKFIQSIIQCSYSGLYVDEYQDTSKDQHNIILCLSSILPCRILGDPLQGIFDFSDDPVNWEKDVYPNFTCFGDLDTPWRWKKDDTHELSEWLSNARKKLEQHNKIDLRTGLPPQVKVLPIDLTDFNNRRRFDPFYSALREKGSFMVIYPGDSFSKNTGHKLSKLLNGRFSSIEEIECKELRSICLKLDSDCLDTEKVISIIEFAAKCFTHVKDNLSAGSLRGECVVITRKCKCPDITEIINSLITSLSCTSILSFLQKLKNSKSCYLCRRDLFNRFICVLELMVSEDIQTFTQAYGEYQNIFRRSGRPLKYSYLIGTTLLIKGLEYDHAIYVDNGKIDEKNLYVALTRASKTLTILTKKTELP